MAEEYWDELEGALRLEDVLENEGVCARLVEELVIESDCPPLEAAGPPSPEKVGVGCTEEFAYAVGRFGKAADDPRFASGEMDCEVGQSEAVRRRPRDQLLNQAWLQSLH